MSCRNRHIARNLLRVRLLQDFPVRDCTYESLYPRFMELPYACLVIFITQQDCIAVSTVSKLVQECLWTSRGHSHADVSRTGLPSPELKQQVAGRRERLRETLFREKSSNSTFPQQNLQNTWPRVWRCGGSFLSRWLAIVPVWLLIRKMTMHW